MLSQSVAACGKAPLTYTGIHIATCLAQQHAGCVFVCGRRPLVAGAAVVLHTADPAKFDAAIHRTGLPARRAAAAGELVDWQVSLLIGKCTANIRDIISFAHCTVSGGCDGSPVFVCRWRHDGSAQCAVLSAESRSLGTQVTQPDEWRRAAAGRGLHARLLAPDRRAAAGKPAILQNYPHA